MSNGHETEDYDTTTALIAGNIAAGVADSWQATLPGGLNNPTNRDAFAGDVVALARAIVAAVKAEPQDP